MTPELLRYYNQELMYLREMGGEFARMFPKIAGRLGMEGFECADPYVERLLEGFSFLAARIQQKLDGRFAPFANQLAELVYPHFAAPTPSMIVVEIDPDVDNPGLAQGLLVPRDTALHSRLPHEGSTRCEYRTAHAVALWPLRLFHADYRPYTGFPAYASQDSRGGPCAVMRLRIGRLDGRPVNELDLDNLTFYLHGSGDLPAQLYEQLLGHALSVVITPVDRGASWQEALPPRCLSAEGLDDDQALLPPPPRAFGGYRLLHEYFSFPERLRFVALNGLRQALKRCADPQFDIVILLDDYQPKWERLVDASRFKLNCTPAINLFPRRGDRIAIDDGRFEHHVVPDRTRPLDFEVYAVQSVRGYRETGGDAELFLPMYRSVDPALDIGHVGGYFQIRRETRLRSEREHRHGGRSRYAGCETYIALTEDPRHGNDEPLRQLALDLLCTNRDLPLSMPLGTGRTDFTLGSDLPVGPIRCVAGPTEPRPMLAEGAAAWRFLRLLSLNYLSLSDGDAVSNAEALRDVLDLYRPLNDDAARRKAAGIVQVASRPVVRRLPHAGPACFGKGLEIAVTLDDDAFEGCGAFLLGAVLQAFFATCVSINHFTETIVRTLRGGERMRWPARSGRCQIL
ncbi:type VI secretion system protein ImpG [Bordetella genomosp. 9]|uniref:type VI secretion system baseplate subunit TssF n=1 Tax=Bordetella genomosp. 9 TaxID=1416803 RepID=UPI000A28FB86|nr:type VI secretion system baseplate subunit TssF [Bordetella genomosp. 9]ARP89540.1 type VI secretion system protein ImpG [Bordetella genomosp. 9]